ncbi:YceI family protein [Herminiimonas sp. NPDC097707]|uniref:YceI family protein n=1 Tax=Herminiimonas sp. NPDC097707 TaxID=3364007 RepID=UPI00383BB8D4
MKRSKFQQTYTAGLLALCVTLLVSCAPETRLQQPEKGTEPVAAFTESDYLQAEAQGKKIFRVNAQQSLLVLEVRRAGAFARFGHDHVVASHDVTGFVSPVDGRADLSVPLEKLVIDEAALRVEAGLSTQPTQEDIEGTRRNMLNKVLDVAQFPLALIHIERKSAESALAVTIKLHGISRSFEVPVEMQATAEGLLVSGKMHFKQSDFGIVPFSILNGAIQVQDRLDLRFRIVAGKF